VIIWVKLNFSFSTFFSNKVLQLGSGERKKEFSNPASKFIANHNKCSTYCSRKMAFCLNYVLINECPTLKNEESCVKAKVYVECASTTQSDNSERSESWVQISISKYLYNKSLKTVFEFKYPSRPVRRVASENFRKFYTH
jgi:hypothetical protein